MSDLAIVRLTTAISRQVHHDYENRVSALTQLLELKKIVDEYKQYPVEDGHICDGNSKCVVFHLHELKSYIEQLLGENVDYIQLRQTYFALCRFIYFKPDAKGG